MLKAGSLLYAIFVTFLLTIISGSILLYVYFSSIIIDGYILTSQSKKNITSAVNIFLANPNILESNSQTNVSPFDKNDESVILKRKYWGIYELIEAEINVYNNKYINVALIGKNQDNHPAIYLKKDISELKISGNTNISGSCYVPNEIIRKTYIAGHQNPGINALPKYIRKSDDNLPDLNKNAISVFNSVKSSSNIKKQSITTKELSDTISQSFTDSTLILYSEKAISLENKVISGNVILISSEKITIHSTNNLNNIILYAPQIEFMPGCTNTLQCFADENIIIRENCNFEFPSCLAILNPGLVSTNIILEENCSFTGEIILDNTNDNTSSIQINKSSIINGLVYSNTSVELYGTVNGSIYTNQFIHKTKSTLYKNQLIDATINLYNLSDYYLYSSVLEKKGNFEIIKWLN